MSGKRFKAEEIVRHYAKRTCLLSQGVSVADVIRRLGVTKITYYRWRREFGGMKVDQARKLKDLERENQRLKKIVATSRSTIRFSRRLPWETSRALAPLAVYRSRVPHAWRVTARACRVVGQPFRRAKSSVAATTAPIRLSTSPCGAPASFINATVCPLPTKMRAAATSDAGGLRSRPPR